MVQAMLRAGLYDYQLYGGINFPNVWSASFCLRRVPLLTSPLSSVMCPCRLDVLLVSFLCSVSLWTNHSFVLGA
jgi:hypothetical protein